MNLQAFANQPFATSHRGKDKATSPHGHPKYVVIDNATKFDNIDKKSRKKYIYIYIYIYQDESTKSLNSPIKESAAISSW